MNHAEQVAQRIIEAVLIGAKMQYLQDQSTSVHDFDLHVGGAVDAVEVTMATDQGLRRMIAQIMDARHGGQFIPTRLCRSDWLVHPLPRADIPSVRAKADEYLAAVEAEGIQQFFAPFDAEAHPSVDRIYSDLSIEAGGVLKWSPPGRIGISRPGGGGIVSSEHLQRAVESEAMKDDNRRKLRNANARERHLFVYVDAHAFRPWIALIDQEPPPTPPSLPPEVDVVWAVTEAPGSGVQCVVWQGRRDGEWRSLGIVPATT